MRPFAAAEIRGNWATLLLPLQADESIDYALLQRQIEAFVRAGVDGVYSNGSAGEFYAQSEDEFDRINGLLAETCERARLPFQIGATHMSPQLALERVRRARALRPVAFQVLLPDWFPTTWDETLAFVERIAAEAAPVPLVIYNPPHAKRRLTPEEWLRLAETVPAVVGIKVPGGDAAWYRSMQPVMRRLSVFVPGHRLAVGLAQGAQGAYSNVACLSPSGAQRWYRLCCDRPEEGQRWQGRILAFWQARVEPLIAQHRLSNMAVDKAVAVAGGWLPGLAPRLRWPYRAAPLELTEQLAAAARAELPELWSTEPHAITRGTA
jgi:4-hydroxy-tetrahydrodipicolinate synthase